MNNPKSHALNGMNNNRINKTAPSDREVSAAWTDTGRRVPKSGVSIPKSQGVENAKEWTDNGSRL